MTYKHVRIMVPFRVKYTIKKGRLEDEYLVIGESPPQQVLLFSARYFFSPAPPFGPNIVASSSKKSLNSKSTNRWVISVCTWFALIPPFSNFGTSATGGTLAPIVKHGGIPDMSLFKNRKNSVTPFRICQDNSIYKKLYLSCIIFVFSRRRTSCTSQAHTTSMITYGLNFGWQDSTQR